ncbi:hypothetical protein [Desulfatirhabdium butyrativorans]|uniref:hypothetical protein n=1 Tax=Desulfatirhabdium butyrativorans TaxID=340467 RepID=UPI0012EB22F9|nr:hypothetical protein [Desulfatirhabdium butyrativorans]
MLLNLLWVGWAILLIDLLVHLVLLFSPFTIDDAFITFSYTRNLVLGNGLVFTVGERAEATSSLLWALMLVPFEAWLADGAILGSKLLGCIGMVSAIFLGILLIRKGVDGSVGNDGSKLIRWAACLFFATLCVLAAPFVQWSCYGMENGAVAALLMLGVFLFDREMVRHSGWISAVPVFLLETIRPEGFLAIFVFGVFRTVVSMRKEASWKPWKDPWWLRWVAVAGTMLFAYEVFGFVQFGNLFPNTASAKAGSFSWEKIHEGIYYFSTTAGRLYLGMIGILGLWLGCRMLLRFMQCRNRALPSQQQIPPMDMGLLPPGQPMEQRFHLLGCFASDNALLLDLLVYGLVATQCVFIVLVGGDWMIDFRFLSHIVPLISLLWVRMTFPVRIDPPENDTVLSGTGQEASAGSRSGWPAAIRFPDGLVRHPAFQVLFLLVYVACQIQAGTKGYEWAKRLADAEERVLKGTALLLESWRKTPQDMVACSDVGRIGYYYRGRVYDWWGLATEEVARSGQAMGKIESRTVLRHQPRFIVLYSNESWLGPDTMQRDMARYSRPFFNDPDFRSDYAAVASFHFWEDRWHIVFERIVPAS